MTSFIIRQFRYPDDYPAAIELWENSGPGVHVARSDAPEEIYKKTLRDPDLFLVAEADGKLIGTVIGGFDGRRGIVYHLAVVPAQRKNGLGAALMEELERRLKAKGCIRAYLLLVKGNQDAAHFYEKRGWEEMSGVTTYGKDLL